MAKFRASETLGQRNHSLVFGLHALLVWLDQARAISTTAYPSSARTIWPGFAYGIAVDFYGRFACVHAFFRRHGSQCGRASPRATLDDRGRFACTRGNE